MSRSTRLPATFSLCYNTASDDKAMLSRQYRARCKTVMNNFDPDSSLLPKLIREIATRSSNTFGEGKSVMLNDEDYDFGFVAAYRRK